jgi:hypothetical protein
LRNGGGISLRKKFSACDAPLGFLTIRDAFDVFAAIHQRKKSAEDARLGLVGQRGSTRGQPGEPLSILGDKSGHFTIAFPRTAAQRRFPPHVHAGLFELQREMQNAALFRLQLRGDAGLTPNHFATYIHNFPRLSERPEVVSPARIPISSITHVQNPEEPRAPLPIQHPLGHAK